MKNKTTIAFCLALVAIIAILSTTSCTKETIEKQIVYRDTIIYRMDNVRINSRETVFLGRDTMIMDLVFSVQYLEKDSATSVDMRVADNSLNIPSDAGFSFFVVGTDMTNFVGLKNPYWTKLIQKSGDYILMEKISIPSLNKQYIMSRPFTVKLKLY